MEDISNFLKIYRSKFAISSGLEPMYDYRNPLDFEVARRYSGKPYPLTTILNQSTRSVPTRDVPADAEAVADLIKVKKTIVECINTQTPMDESITVKRTIIDDMVIDNTGALRSATCEQAQQAYIDAMSEAKFGAGISATISMTRHKSPFMPPIAFCTLKAEPYPAKWDLDTTYSSMNGSQ